MEAEAEAEVEDVRRTDLGAGPTLLELGWRWADVEDTSFREGVKDMDCPKPFWN